MKKLFKIYKSILMVLLASFCLNACDKIPEDEYLTPIESVGPGEIEIVDPSEIGEVKQHVILEEFTGLKCTNCASAAKLIEGLKNNYKDQLIPIAVHATRFAVPDNVGKYTAEYRTKEGIELAAYYKENVAPKGMINRVTNGGKITFFQSAWAANIQREANVEPTIKLKLEDINFNESTNKVSAKLKAIFLNKVTEDMRINVLITEDSIIGTQANDDASSGTTPSIENYVYMHMLRKTEYGIWGSMFVKASDNLQERTQKTIPLEIQLDSKWKAKNCHIVVYISTDDPTKTNENYRIIQAIEKPIISSK